jgi:hypothetical protein
MANPYDGNALAYGQPAPDPNNPLTQGTPTLADAWQFNAQAAQGWVNQQRAQSEQMGLWGPQGITPAGAQAAGSQMANMLAMATTAPGAKGATLANPAFANWFGKSKIVDDAGNPQMMYHGSNADVHAFDLSKSGQARGHADESAIFLTSDPKLAGGYADIVGSDAGAANAGVVYPVHVQAENPFQSNLDYYNSAAFAREIAKAKQQGHDSIQFPKLTYEGEHGQMAVFSPTQLKSAIGNRGTYSPSDPRLTYGAAGLAAGAAAASGNNTPPQ